MLRTAREGRGESDGPEDRSLYDRCITRGVPGSMMPAQYGDAYRGAWAQAGHPADAADIAVAAKRIVGVKRQYNRRAGWTVDEDTLPERFLNTPLPSDPTAALGREQLGVLVAEYHRQRGW